MKKRSVKSILLIFLFLLVSVNAVSNFACLTYLQNVNSRLEYKECSRISVSIRDELEQKAVLLHNFSSRIYLELFRLDYFRNQDEKEFGEKRRAVQESADLLNEFTEKQVHLVVTDEERGLWENYSRIISEAQMECFQKVYETMDEEERDYPQYQILDMEEAFGIVELQPFYIQDVFRVENRKYGSILSVVLVEKQELYEKFNLPKSLELFVYEAGDEAQGSRDRGTFAAAASRNLEIGDADYTVECVLRNGKDISGFQDSRAMILLQLAINIFVAGLCIYTLIKYIANPLNTIVEHMMSIDFGSREKHLPDHFRCSEIEIVANQFNQLIERLDEKSKTAFYTQQRLYEMKLCEKERDMKALQSQINPHFIYNMLENIRVLAELGQNEAVAKVTVRMAEFLRYSLYINGFVTLEDELAATEAYLEIMKICYDHMFRVEYSIQEELKTHKVPKMILQPLIGNVFKHGFVFEHSENVIRVEMERKDDRILIRVSDNGIGMSKEALDKLNQELMGNAMLERDRGFGLFSINRRIKTIYGEEYGIFAESLVNAYTRMTIALPVQIEEE